MNTRRAQPAELGPEPETRQRLGATTTRLRPLRYENSGDVDLWSHYQVNGFSLPIAVLTDLTTRVPDQRILTTDRCFHYQINGFSLPIASRYQINEFSLPIAVLAGRPMNSHYRSLFSLPDQ